MPEITITEALAEIKTIHARIAKKREAILRHLSRDSRLRDPLEADGGSPAYVRRERQSIQDLEDRIVHIRTQIQYANLSNTLTIAGTTLSVAAWLNWRREVAPNRKAFGTSLVSAIASVRQQAAKQGMAVTEKDSGGAAPDVVISLNEQQLSGEIEQIETCLGTLDGKLSLFNATAKIGI